MKSPTTISIIIAILIIGGMVFFTSQKNSNSAATSDSNTSASATGQNITANAGSSNSSSNVSVVGGVQIIELQAKGGYSPRQSIAKAGIPTLIRFKTNGTFDCSSSIRIPSLNISQYLPATGNTDVNIGTQAAGLFRGSCGMGMYPFEIDFQ